MRVLLLGGTADAAALAGALVEVGTDVETSLAGRTSHPATLPGRVRVGGFGGIAGLEAHLRAGGFDALVDATHPFAARMPWNAAEAAAAAGVPRLRLLRPGWQEADGDRWVRVPLLEAAAVALRDLGAERVFLTTGRQDLAPFAAADTWFLVRSIEPPGPLPFPRAEVVLARGPFTVEEELALLRAHRIDAVVTKDSGAAAVAAKLAAARRLGIPVVVVDRPPQPPGPTVSTVAAALDWLAAPPSPTSRPGQPPPPAGPARTVLHPPSAHPRT